MIEEYHKARKTGCGIEEPRVTTGQVLRAAIAIQSVVARQLPRLRDLSRRSDAATRPARDVVDGEYVDPMIAGRFKEVRAEMRVHEFYRALAKIGGHLNRTHDRAAGWLVLWHGWTKLQLRVEGARTAKIRRWV